MPEGIYVAFAGALANQRALDVIANNIANVSTSGFKRDTTLFDAELGAELHFADAEASRLDLTIGQQQLTGDPLQAAIDGDGFFVVEGEDGQEYYTRRGDFRLSADGWLTLPNGMRVTGSGLRVPAGSRAQLTGSGTLVVDDVASGRLLIKRFEDTTGLEKVGESLIRAPEDTPAIEVDQPALAVGYVESSNVNLAAEMVALITASRAFEAAVRSMTIQDQLTQQLIQTQNA
jgi:flagellar basal-body rod protein FlgG